MTKFDRFLIIRLQRNDSQGITGYIKNKVKKGDRNYEHLARHFSEENYKRQVLCSNRNFKGRQNKYELDKETGMLKLDRVLFTSTHYPANYGFIPRTFADDGDPLDVLVLCSETIQPMTLVECKPIGVLNMVDNDSCDEKIIAVPVNDPNYNCYSDISELPKHYFEEIQHFFQVYKTLEADKVTSVTETDGVDKAKEIIEKAITSYIRDFQMA